MDITLSNENLTTSTTTLYAVHCILSDTFLLFPLICEFCFSCVALKSGKNSNLLAATFSVLPSRLSIYLYYLNELSLVIYSYHVTG